MERSQKVSILVALLLATLMVSPIFGRDININRFDDDDEANPPKSDFSADPPIPEEGFTQEYAEFLQNCSNKVTGECGKEVFTSMFQDTNITNECCIELMKMGWKCHLALVDTIFKTPNFKDKAELGIPRSMVTWNSCVKNYGGEMDAPIPYEYINGTFGI